MSRNCPDNATVRSHGQGPPGTSAFSMEPVPETESEGHTEVLDSLPLGAMCFGDPEQEASVSPWPLEEWRAHYPYWKEPHILPRASIGDCYAMVVDSILTMEAPFPGDHFFEVPTLRPELRFHVSRDEKTSSYEVVDRLTGLRSTVPRDLLENAEFNVSGWYAEQRARALGLTEEKTHRYPIGDAIATVVKKLLTDGIASSYPCTNTGLDPADRFWVQRSEGDYLIIDVDLELDTHIPTTWLEEPTFDLISWYRQHIDELEIFEQRYYEAHRELCIVVKPPHSHEWHTCSVSHELQGCPGVGEARDPRKFERQSMKASLHGTPEPKPSSVNEFNFEDLFETKEPTDETVWDDLPELQSVSESEDEGEEGESSNKTNKPFEEVYDDMLEELCKSQAEHSQDSRIERVQDILTKCQPFPGDGEPVDPSYYPGESRFLVEKQGRGFYCIYDRVQGFETDIHESRVQWGFFSIGLWFAERCAVNSGLHRPWDRARQWMVNRKWEDTVMVFEPRPPVEAEDVLDQEPVAEDIELAGIQVDKNKYPTLQRNAAQVKGNQRVLPKPIIVKVTVNDHPARALLDSGSLGDFMSSTLADQLGLKKTTLDVPLALQLAVQGSRSKVNSVATVQLRYQEINERRTFDIINLNSYDLILGTPWMHQHQVCIGFNPARIIIGSDDPQPLKMGADTKLMAHSLAPENQSIEDAREELRRYADPLCKEMSETDLPPLRAINHTIPLIDETKTYPWRPSRCPEAFRAQWAEKRDAYIKSGRWSITSAGNTVPMLLIPKPGTNPPRLRVVVDLRERNKNTHKLTSPLPDMEGMLRRAASKPFRTMLDLKDAYEQIRIVPEHVKRSVVTTPDGNMVSQVIQQGDCNAPATYQALMNFLFSSYVGRFMDIYLDDIIIYSRTLEEHVRHVKLVLDILKRERLYLSRSKLHFVVAEVKLLGRVIDDEGIRMDAEKVDSVLSWKVPTNRDLLRGFIGSVGYLADDIPNVRIPMGILSSITGDTVPFRWGYTEQRAFEEVKTLVHQAREHRRVPLDYLEGAPPIWMVTDGCSTGISGLVSQGKDWKTAKIAAFYSAKLNPAQQNYPVHEIEMLAGVETMLRHVDILQGAKFKWLTDHKGLTYLLNQKNLSGRQARWLEKISSYTFEVVYVPGSENVVADALSRIYSNDSIGTERARSEYTYHDVVDDDTSTMGNTVETTPLLAGIEAQIATRRGTRVRRPTQKAAEMLESPTPVRTVTNPSKNIAHRVKSRSMPKDTASPAVTTEGGNTAITMEDDDAATSEPSEGTLLNIVSQTQGINLLAELRGKFELDPAFKSIMERPKDFRNFVVEEQLVYLKEAEKKVLCIPKVMIQGRSAREIVISEAHSMLAHLGASKTVDYLRDHAWWRDMVSDVRAFCETCHTCKSSKPSNQKPYGLLNPLSVPSYPWESIGMDFVGPLPESGNRDGLFDSITVVICLLTSMVHLVPSRTNYNASQLAELMFEHVYKLHGLPKNIISDRDVLFTSIFWKHLHRLIGTKLRLSSAYHPQSDGSTERANRTITQMLRQCVHSNQKDWVAKLPAIEFAINSARSESTGFAPFFLNSGRMPRSMIWDSPSSTEFPSVRDFALQKKLAIESAHDSILSARVKQTRDANRKRRAAPFKQGELVYLSTKHISFAKGLARKLLPKFIGPYKILHDFGNSSFRLELPSDLKRRGVHDVFHSSLLREHIPNDDRLFPGRLDTQIGITPDVEGEWAVERILSHAGSKYNPIFEIMWKSGDITWLPYYQITHLQALVDYLELFGVKKVSKLPKGTGQPPQDDPQVFLGNVSFSSPPIPISAPSLFSRLKNRLISATQHIISLVSTFFRPSSKLDGTYYSLPVHTHSISYMRNTRRSNNRDRQLPGANHPMFTRLTPTVFRVKDRNYSVSSTVHVAQIAEYIRFDEELRTYGNNADFASFPLGYPAFVKAWNEGTTTTDTRHFSTIYLANDPAHNEVVPSTHPLRLSDFHIDPTLLGNPQNTPPPADPAQDSITREYGIMMAAQQKRQREFAEARRQKRITAGNFHNARTNSARVFKRRNNPRPRQPRTPSPSPEPQNNQKDHPATSEDEEPEDTAPPNETTSGPTIEPTPMEEIHE